MGIRWTLRRLDPQFLLVAALRLGAALTLLAFFAALLPLETMARIHHQLGLGELPLQPIVAYLARSLSLFYGFHGVLLLLVSFDLERFDPIVAYLGWMNTAIGVGLLFVDLGAGMPAWWTRFEGPFVISTGVLLLALRHWSALRQRRHRLA